MSDETPWFEVHQVSDVDGRAATRKFVLIWLGRIAFLALLLIGVAVATDAYAAPRLGSEQECELFSDMSLVVAALAKHGVSRATTVRMLPDIYQMNSAEGKELMRLMVVWLYDRTDPEKINPIVVITEFYTECLRKGGNVDRLLVGTGA